MSITLNMERSKAPEKHFDERVFMSIELNKKKSKEFAAIGNTFLFNNGDMSLLMTLCLLHPLIRKKRKAPVNRRFSNPNN